MNRQKELIIINKVLATLVVVLAFSCGLMLAKQEEWNQQENQPKAEAEAKKHLPLPDFNGIMVMEPKKTPLVTMLKNARYVHQISATEPISKQQLMSLAWSAQGQITEWGERTVPSYKSQFPLSVAVWVGQVGDVAPGWYGFEPETQQLIPMETQFAIPDNQAAMAIQISKKVDAKVQDELVWYEAGGVAQNVILMSQELGLDAMFVLGQQNPDLWTIYVGKGNL